MDAAVTPTVLATALSVAVLAWKIANAMATMVAVIVIMLELS